MPPFDDGGVAGMVGIFSTIRIEVDLRVEFTVGALVFLSVSRRGTDVVA